MPFCLCSRPSPPLPGLHRHLCRRSFARRITASPIEPQYGIPHRERKSLSCRHGLSAFSAWTRAQSSEEAAQLPPTSFNNTVRSSSSPALTTAARPSPPLSNSGGGTISSSVRGTVALHRTAVKPASAPHHWPRRAAAGRSITNTTQTSPHLAWPYHLGPPGDLWRPACCRAHDCPITCCRPVASPMRRPCGDRTPLLCNTCLATCEDCRPTTTAEAVSKTTCL